MSFLKPRELAANYRSYGSELFFPSTTRNMRRENHFERF